MLVLTRRPGESIIIAGDIKITVVNVGPGRVKLGIEAPSHVRVDRQEIHDKIEQSADVLATVGGEVTLDSQNTMISSGPDTAMISTAVPTIAPQAAQATVPPLGKLSKYRLPRKPR
ncbi:carbon storage regulator [Gemmata sp. G18]|uniref:Translational regulator CsrA n=1 Tax=Gemmata palustris TaxID=2822762 RepID=A0ABS5C138_9BACT|nr:carbon storage regulator [Gemmata palustris]MBP3959367.1 carbon storage regulator [Gemmata palustris]